jgi:hypothetical protein
MVRNHLGVVALFVGGNRHRFDRRPRRLVRDDDLAPSKAPQETLVYIRFLTGLCDIQRLVGRLEVASHAFQTGRKGLAKDRELRIRQVERNDFAAIRRVGVSPEEDVSPCGQALGWR